MDDGVDSDGRRVEREPEPAQAPGAGPGRGSMPVMGGQMLGEGSQHDIPALVSGSGRLFSKQGHALVGCLMPALFEEFGHQPPPGGVITCLL